MQTRTERHVLLIDKHGFAGLMREDASGLFGTSISDPKVTTLPDNAHRFHVDCVQDGEDYLVREYYYLLVDSVTITFKEAEIVDSEISTTHTTVVPFHDVFPRRAFMTPKMQYLIPMAFHHMSFEDQRTVLPEFHSAQDISEMKAGQESTVE